MAEPIGDPETWVEHRRFHHCSAGLFIGGVSPQPKAGEFDAVLTVADAPRSVDDSIRHKHIPLSYQVMDPDALTQAIDWTYAQFQADRTVLVRSEGGKERPALVVAGTFLRMGATLVDAIVCVRKGRSNALQDFRYLNMLRALAEPPAR